MNNQELEFRVWDVRLNFFLPTNDTDGKFNPLWFQNENKNGEQYVIQQYTGYKDENGRYIYDGDFVKITDMSGKYIIQVCWNDLRLCVDGQRKVIGNIFENPELLK